MLASLDKLSDGGGANGSRGIPSDKVEIANREALARLKLPTLTPEGKEASPPGGWHAER